MTTALDERRSSPRVLLRVADLTAREPAAPIEAIALEVVSDSVASATAKRASYRDWIDYAWKTSWQFRVCVLAILVGVKVIAIANNRTAPAPPRRQPSPISSGEAANPRVSAAPTIVREGDRSAPAAVASDPNQPVQTTSTGERLARRIVPPQRGRPGVAEFEGSIASPILEANHDSSRPGIH